MTIVVIVVIVNVVVVVVDMYCVLCGFHSHSFRSMVKHACDNARSGVIMYCFC